MKAALPKPDAFGNYWFGKGTTGPVILKSGRSPNGCNQYFVSTGETGIGVLFEDGEIAYFKSPGEAYDTLRKLVNL